MDEKADDLEPADETSQEGPVAVEAQIEEEEDYEEFDQNLDDIEATDEEQTFASTEDIDQEEFITSIKNQQENLSTKLKKE